MNTSLSDRVRDIVASIIDRMGFEAQISVREPICEGQGDFICNIRVEEDSNLLIGQHGINLQALQHIVRLLVKKEFQESVHFSLDVNSYWEQKSHALIKEANTAAETVLLTQAPVILRPMAGYERKLIHAELANNPAVITESSGINEHRKVVVKPAPLGKEA